MYPKISDFINEIMGTQLDLPIQSYGFFLALAFLFGGWLLYLELKRMSLLGYALPTIRMVVTGKQASWSELVLFFLIGAIIGYKLAGIIFHYPLFTAGPQQYIFSTEGSIAGGIITGLALASLQYFLKKRKATNPPVEKSVTVLPQEQLWPVIFIAVIFGLIGAKIFHQLENWDTFLKDPVNSLLSFSGLTFYGGFVVAAVAVGIYVQKHGIPWKRMADAIAPSLMLSYGIGRIGCQVAGDGDWGIVNLAPKPSWLSWLPDDLWSYTYPHNILNRGIPIDGCTGDHCFQLAQPVFPTPVYETSMAILLFLLLWFMRKRIKTAGVLFAIYLMFNGAERFIIEKIRVNNTYSLWGWEITQAEIISTLLFLTGLAGLVVLLLYDRKKAHKHES